MKIVNLNGEIRNAWLNGEELDETCRGLRFRLAVGTSGGIVCDAITGNVDLTPIQIEQLATQAVINTDPLDKPLPIVDDLGEPAKILIDPTHVQPVETIIRTGKSRYDKTEQEPKTTNPIGFMLIGAAVFINLVVEISWFGLLMGVVGGLLLTRQSKERPGMTTAHDTAAEREKERKDRLPEGVTRMA